MVFTFCGPSCAGKDTIVNNLDFCNKLIQHTTRPIRPGETDGVEYYFHKSKDEAIEPFSMKEFTVASGDKWYYWFETNDVKTAIESKEIYVSISDIDGTLKLFELGADVIFIDVPLESRIKRYYAREILKREPDYKEAMRRLISDIDDFSKFNSDKYTSERFHKVCNSNKRIEEVVKEVTDLITSRRIPKIIDYVYEFFYMGCKKDDIPFYHCIEDYGFEHEDPRGCTGSTDECIACWNRKIDKSSINW